MTVYLTIVVIKTIMFTEKIAQIKKGTITMVYTESYVENPSGRVYITIHSHHPLTEEELRIIQTANLGTASTFAKSKGWTITVNNKGGK